MEPYNGIIEDPRSDEAKAQDIEHASLAMGMNQITWEKKAIDSLKKYTPRDQYTSLSCCGQGSAKGVETITGKVMSAHPPYRSRANYPQAGMFIQDIGDVWKKIGSNLEEEDQSQNLKEVDLNRNITVPTPYKIGGYLFPKPTSIDEVAQAVENYKHCILTFHCTHSEWWSEKPIYNGATNDLGHCVCATDYLLDEEGNKCLVIEDSAYRINSINKMGQRIITEDFLSKRCVGAIYFTSVNPIEMPYIFHKLLSIGSEGFDVKKLQAKLGIKVDGIFGLDTRHKVQDFQKAHNLIADGTVGPKTNLELNK